MTAEDLTHDAPSVLVESRKLMDDVLERRQNAQSAPDYVAPDTPFWRVPPKVRNKKPPTWRATAQEDEDVAAGGKDGPRPPADVAEAAERLQGIVDVGGKGTWRFDSVSPAKAASNLLVTATPDVGDGGDRGGALPEQKSLAVRSSGTADEDAGAKGSREETKKVLESAVERATSRRKAAGASAEKKPRHASGLGEGLIATLRQQATEYEKTGVNPDLAASLAEALEHHPGTERATRLREMQACTASFDDLVLEGKASLANCNELVRAQALQGRMDDAMRTHDAMKLHGFEPDAETFVSLLAGAAKQRDADLSRQLFLKMREQLISATPKVYATLMQAHVRAGDTASGYSLLRKMEDERLQPDVVVHTVLINGLVAEGRLEKAWDEFHSIRTWKLIQPDEVLFTVMIKACALNEEAERALNLLDDLRMCGLYPTDVTYGELIHAMSTTPDHAWKAFDFYRQMQAEDLPLSPFIFEKLLQACRNLGDAKRARATVQEMNEHGIDLSPDMYCHLVGLFATALRRPKVTETEKLQHLRCAWYVVAEARRTCSDQLDWTAMLNEVLGVYVAGGFTNFAMDMLRQYPLFGAEPDAETWEHLLTMFAKDLKDVGRFFTLWGAIPKDPQPPDELYHLALDMALHSRSSRRTCAVLEEMHAAAVFPTPQLTERLAKAGRHVIQIHHLISKFITLNQQLKVSQAKRETGLLQTHMDEREVLLAADGLTVRSPTPEQEERDKYFKMMHKQGAFKRPWLPFGEYLVSKQKGGEAYAKRDRPRPNLLAASSSSVLPER